MIIQKRYCSRCGKFFGCSVKYRGEKIQKKCIWCFRLIVLWECPKGKMGFDETGGICPKCYVVWRTQKFFAKLFKSKRG